MGVTPKNHSTFCEFLDTGTGPNLIRLDQTKPTWKKFIQPAPNRTL